ncbi:MAG: VCBS repeat-containing protein [Chloroflexaceae bacterium]|nr:VCBS repeat-containing protein [Chloroflexaceae bacterium]NJL33021.1 VCBS repeat-containing protein [Chloroflexaceae bacterium]NJO06079.1 VCBS repeat-containing protein [Chloroflexaceae bacterium]
MAVVSRPVAHRRAWRRGPLQHWLQRAAFIASGLLVLLAVGLVMQHTLDWGQRYVDGWRYGFPRRAYLSAYVGHGDERQMPTQFITLNLNGQISTLVLPGGDTAAVVVLPGPYLVGADGPYTAAVPAIRDVNNDGHVDLLVNVRGEVIVYINRNGQFELLTPDEHAALEQRWDGE